MCNATDTRLWEIRNYVSETSVQDIDQSSLPMTKDLLALGEFTQEDFYGAILLAFSYGRAKGWQAAKGRAAHG